MLENNAPALRQQMMDDFLPDTKAMDEMRLMGFDDALIKLSLRCATNDMNAAVETLLKMQADGTYESMLNNVTNLVGGANGAATASASDDEGAVGGVEKAAANLAKRLKYEQKTLEVCLCSC